MLDACSMAIYSALSCTMMPKLNLLTGESGVVDDFELLSTDISDSISLPVDAVPIIITVSKVIIDS